MSSTFPHIFIYNSEDPAILKYTKQTNHILNGHRVKITGLSVPESNHINNIHTPYNKLTITTQETNHEFQFETDKYIAHKLDSEGYISNIELHREISSNDFPARLTPETFATYLNPKINITKWRISLESNVDIVTTQALAANTPINPDNIIENLKVSANNIPKRVPGNYTYFIEFNTNSNFFKLLGLTIENLNMMQTLSHKEKLIKSYSSTIQMQKNEINNSLKNAPNIENVLNIYKFKTQSLHLDHHIPPGNYTNMSEFASAISNTALTASYANNKFRLKVAPGYAQFTIPSKLANMLKLPIQEAYTDITSKSEVLNLHDYSIYPLMIKTNIVEPSLINGKYQNILGLIDWAGNWIRTKVLLNRPIIDNIEIVITDSHGEKISYSGGSSIISLKFYKYEFV